MSRHRSASSISATDAPFQAFTFDAGEHEYRDVTGAVRPHITGMLKKGGLIDDTWFKEEHSERGRIVHSLCADYDLGAIDLESCVSRFRPYLLGHVDCVKVMRPTFFAVEEPWVHSRHGYGGRPDRGVEFSYCKRGVWDTKSKSSVTASGDERAPRVQTALQAILYEDRYGLPAEMWGRFVEYLDAKGKWKVKDHNIDDQARGLTKAKDFAEARRLIKAYC